MRVTNDYDYLNNCANNWNGDNQIIIKYLLLSFPNGVLLLSLIGLILYTMIKPLSSHQLNIGLISSPFKPKPLY